MREIIGILVVLLLNGYLLYLLAVVAVALYILHILFRAVWFVITLPYRIFFR